jgi:hypothetical protein
VRRALVTAVTAFIVAVISSSAGAVSSPPTAKALVKKLVAAHVCAEPVVVVNVPGTVATCGKEPLTVSIHAFKSKTAALRALEAFRISECADTARTFGHSIDSISFTVAKTWFTNSYIDQIGEPLRAALGGKVKTYGCS